ncbi:MAG: hypothetical protein F6K30_11670 [Cyanothece sp. SIO2G6]|nr:hypothetical protein [Cyanothece sp. SIO2G6]
MIIETGKGRSLNVTGRGVIAGVLEGRSLWSRLQCGRSAPSLMSGAFGLSLSKSCILLKEASP